MKKNLGLIAVKLVERNSFFVGGWWVLGGFASSGGAHHVVIYVSPLIGTRISYLLIRTLNLIGQLQLVRVRNFSFQISL